MSETCSHDCSTCKSNCASKKEGPTYEPLNSASNVKHVIGIVSGKGGVGKSAVTSMLAVETSRKGLSTAILDADITGPSIPKAFGLKGGNVTGSELGMFPELTKTGIRVMSLNLLTNEESQPVVWRGPVIAGTVKQFWTDVVWGDVDFMYVDMPPGTGDVPLTVFQSIPLSGIVIVASPQELVSVIVEKALKMAEMMNVKVLGLVENMSYFKCPDCGKEHKIFGDSHVDELAAKYSIPVLAKIPFDPSVAALSDKGIIELMENDYFAKAVDMIQNLD